MDNRKRTELKAIAAAIVMTTGWTTGQAFAEPTPSPGNGSQEMVKGPGGDRVKIGDLMPDLGLEQLLQSPDGAETTLDGLRGKVVLIEFWATWCAPCVAAFPHLNELAGHLDDDEFVFIAITDESREKVEPFLAKKPLNTWIGLDTDRSVLKQFGVNGIPRTVIVDTTGHIVADTYPTEVTVSALERIRDGKSHGLSDMSKMMGGDGGPSGMPGMPTSIAELNEMQLQGTAPGPEHEPLAALAGKWLIETSMSPAGPMGPTLTGSAHSTHTWIQGGRVLQATEAIDGDSPIVQHSYFGFDREKQEYYLCEISPLEPAPAIWSGTWNADKSQFVFTRQLKIMMGGPGGPSDDNDGVAPTEVPMKLTMTVSGDDKYTTALSIDFSSLGMGGPAGEQIMSESIATRME